MITKCADTFAADGNSGLVEQVAISQAKANIKRLTKTFLTLSLNELSARSGLDSKEEAERMLVDMVCEGSIKAKISQKDGENTRHFEFRKMPANWHVEALHFNPNFIGMVRFDAGPTEVYNSEPILQSLETAISSCVSLDAQIEVLDRDIMLNPTFVKRSVSTMGAGGPGGPGGPGGVAVGSHGNMDDEAVGAEAGSSEGLHVHAGPSMGMPGSSAASSTTGNGVI